MRTSGSHSDASLSLIPALLLLLMIMMLIAATTMALMMMPYMWNAWNRNISWILNQEMTSALVRVMPK